MTGPKTVLVTGATGYIGKHTVAQLLDAGYDVVGSTTRPSGEAEVRNAIRGELSDPSRADSAFRAVQLDLRRDEGWHDALDGVDALLHTASPFPLAQPKDPDELIRPAVDGARRALAAAADAGVDRVVLTSSAVAVVYADLPPGRTHYDERDWSDPDPATTSAYVRSKTLAERAAWELAAQRGLALTTINPGFVQGAPLDQRLGTSSETVQRALSGKDPMVPKVAFSIVHVRDVAAAHVRALAVDDAIGERFLVAGPERWFVDLTRTLKDAYPDRRIATREAPNLLIRGLGLVDRGIRSIVNDLGKLRPIDGSKATRVLGIDYRDADDAIRETAAHLVANGLA